MKGHARFGAVLLAALLLLTALNVIQIGLSMLSMGARLDWMVLVRARGLLLVLAVLWLPLLLLIRRRWPAQRVGFPAHAVWVLGALAAFGLVEWLLGNSLERWAVGPGLMFRGSQTAKVIGDLISLACAVAVALAVDLRGQLRQREAEASRLEARLAEARLQALSHQIHPHFLFNTLSMISVLVHRDPAAADAMLTRLADLLRATLRRPATQEVPLREELAWLEGYLDIMRMRFGQRLTIELAVPPELAECRVPSFILQPLVENALEHGIERRSGPGSIRIGARARGSRLRIEVVDDGPGPSAAADGAADGIGLANARRRLEQLYGGEQSLTLEPAPGGGGRAVFEIPMAMSAADAAPS